MSEFYTAFLKINRNNIFICRANRMPEIYAYRCNICNFYFPCGWGGYMYVTDEKGKRIACYHPGELSTAYQVLGMDVSEVPYIATIKSRKDNICDFLLLIS